MKYIVLSLALIMATPFFSQEKEEKNEKKDKKEEKKDKEGKKDKEEKKDKKEKPSKDGSKFMYKDITVETDDYKVYIIDAVAVDGLSKFKIKIFNKTNDFLLVKPSEFAYKTESKTVANTEKNFIIAPNDETTRVIDFKGSTMLVEKYMIEVKGIYKASAAAKALEVPNFDLPPTKNDFSVGSFNCVLKKNEASTDKASAKFECSYNGDAIGIIFPYKAACIMPNGTDNANSKKNSGILLEKGRSDDFTLVFNEVVGAGDLQKKAVKIKWNDTFKESKLMKLADNVINMEKSASK